MYLLEISVGKRGSGNSRIIVLCSHLLKFLGFYNVIQLQLLLIFLSFTFTTYSCFRFLCYPFTLYNANHSHLLPAFIYPLVSFGFLWFPFLLLHLVMGIHLFFTLLLCSMFFLFCLIFQMFLN
jgi:hypothetical protein